ncbi:MAG: DUF2147 domain-containing protein [Treponema sp.]|jgi:uncharacterized protein (DUF2147 family)|nr:DUF2147 domain-containing protein [Treponema sp.]
MKKRVVVGIFLLIAAGICFAADPAEGYWKSVDEKSGDITGGWYIYQKDGKLYGEIVSAPSVNATTLSAEKKLERYQGFPYAERPGQRAVLGTTWIFGLTPVKNKPGAWEKGHIIDPNDGSLYQCKITLHTAGTKVGSRTFSVDTLEMRGEIGLGIGRSQYWLRATEAEAKSVK